MTHCSFNPKRSEMPMKSGAMIRLVPLLLVVDALAGCFVTGRATATTTVRTTTIARPTFNPAVTAAVAPPAEVQVLQAQCQPGTQEACNGLDDNCDGVIDEGCGYSGGNIQITAAWQTASDIDLHVVDPAGHEIYYAQRNSASGGTLDHDANAACAVAPPTVENVYWNTQDPPRGQYQVRIVAYDMCGVPSTPVTLSISVGGRVVGTYSATFVARNQSHTIPFTVP
jgi:tRNA (guanosine-2'-O-)-methyltransferase